MSLRKKFRDWNVRRLLHNYEWAKADYTEWELRVDTSDPRDKAKQSEQLDYHTGVMSFVLYDLYWKYGYDEGKWYIVGDMQFYLQPSYEHVKDALTVAHRD
jgi:hypothetical protein